jgi:hypothetical protein
VVRDVQAGLLPGRRLGPPGRRPIDQRSHWRSNLLGLPTNCLLMSNYPAAVGPRIGDVTGG